MMRAAFAMMLAFSSGALGSLDEAKAEYAEQDKALNEMYGRLKKELEPRVFAMVQKSQREWVEFKDYMADWQAQGEEPEISEERWELAAGLTESRVSWLAAWLKQDQRKGWEGRYSDGYGRHWFYVEVVRGPTFHLGEMGGEFRVKGRTGWFEVKAEYDDESTWLTFLQEDDGSGRVKVVGENTQPYHGARAYFDGSYLWMGELREKEKADVIAGENSLEK